MDSSYWLFDESDVGAVVCSAEFVRSLEMVEPAGVLVWEPTY